MPPRLEPADYVFVYFIELETNRNPIEYGPFVSRDEAKQALRVAEPKYGPYPDHQWEVIKSALPRKEALKRLAHKVAP